MFFRFGVALCLIVLVALWGTSLEKQNLELKRAISQQHYRRDALLDMQVRLRLEAQRLGTPAKLMETLERGEIHLQRPKKSVRSDERRSPLLNWNSE
jgi:hypothetical protein